MKKCILVISEVSLVLIIFFSDISFIFELATRHWRDIQHCTWNTSFLNSSIIIIYVFCGEVWAALQDSVMPWCVECNARMAWSKGSPYVSLTQTQYQYVNNFRFMSLKFCNVQRQFNFSWGDLIVRWAGPMGGDFSSDKKINDCFFQTPGPSLLRKFPPPPWPPFMITGSASVLSLMQN